MTKIHRRLLIAVLIVAPLLLLVSFACNEQNFGAARIDSFEVSPTTGSGSFTITVTVIPGTFASELKCEVPDLDNPAKMVPKINQTIEASASEFPSPQILVDQFYITKPGFYRASCSIGEQQTGASFSVSIDGISSAPSRPSRTTSTTPTTSTTAPPATSEPQLPGTSAESDESGDLACSQWDITGKWKLSQSNNFHPDFTLTQQGATIIGNATVSTEEQARAGFSSPTGSIFGKIAGNQVTLVVIWPPRNSDRAVLSATYKGTVTDGQMEGKVDPNDSWSAEGPTKCAG